MIFQSSFMVVYMKLRKLEIKDAQLMLEWMHDKDVVKDLGTDFLSKTLDDCVCFIKHSRESNNNVHMAVADENDVYMGTVSLKAIDRDFRTAEFAITVRKQAMGKGFSSYAMKEIIRIGFEELNLKAIYWCVLKDNKRAVRFYDKNGYSRTSTVNKEIYNRYSEEQNRNFFWYCAYRE